MKNTITKLRRCLWRARRQLARIIDPSRSVSSAELAIVRTSSGQDNLGVKESRNAVRYEDATGVARAEANRLWDSGSQDAAIDTLRRALLSNPQSSLTWMSYGHRLQDLGKYDLAFEAYHNSVDLDAGNFAALEQFLDICALRNEKKRQSAILKTIVKAIEDKPNRHREVLNFAIPHKLRDVVDVVASSPDIVARAVAELQATDGDQDTELIRGLSEDERNICYAIWCLARGRKDAAVRAIRRLPDSLVPISSLRLAIRRELARGREAGAHKLLVEYCRLLPDDKWGKSKLSASKLTSDHQMATLGFPFPERVAPSVAPARNRVDYLLHNSLPYHSAGYATRTHGLLSALRAKGWSVEGVTRLGYPYDMPNFKDLGDITSTDLIDGVPYHRLSTSPVVEMKRPIEKYVARYSESLIERFNQSRPFLVHAASNHWNGLTAVAVANRLGLESVYEVRGLWEVTRASRDAEWAGSDAYRYMSRMEADAANNASHVIAITHALKAELVARGVESEKITVVPNGVDADRFTPLARDRHLARELGIESQTVIGYVGSVLDYEGLNLLAEAVAKVEYSHDAFRVLVVGDGTALGDLKSRVEDLHLEHLFIFTGRVPHELVESYYSLVDIAPFPRLPLPVCEMVSPLKPFEAMAMGKAVVASDVAALSEIVQHGKTGILHRKGDSTSLADALDRLLSNPAWRTELSRAARDWVVEKRQWEYLSDSVGEIYSRLGGSPDDAKKLEG